MTSEGKILAIGHAETPESTYGNPQLFPSMLPWLFPHGLGGIGQTEHKYKLSSMMHKQHLLMYYDKRFQKDPHFPLIAFNHEQMKESTTAGYLTAERKSLWVLLLLVLTFPAHYAPKSYPLFWICLGHPQAISPCFLDNILPSGWYVISKYLCFCTILKITSLSSCRLSAWVFGM